MPSRSTAASPTHSIEDELAAPWVLLEYLAKGGSVVRSKALDNIEDAGRTEDRIRHDYTGRYPLELLQNAHDACADAHRQGAVRFAVTPSALLVANEGVPFTHERIRSIVRLGSSEKVKERNVRRTIGYKGVGFTAVFEITDRPQIISSTTAFEFDRRRAQREVGRALGTAPSDVPARGFPFRLSDEAWADDADVVRSFMKAGAVTVIRLPFRANRTPGEVAEHVTETILPEALLFMTYVNEFEVVLPEGSERWKRTAGRRVGPGRVTHLRGAAGERRSWLVATTAIKATRSEIEALEDPLWSGVRDLSAAIAVPWKNGPYPEAGAQKMHVYFPTDDDLGRALLIHGDFYVDSGRRHIESRGPGGDVSRAVAEAAARLAATVAESVADQGGRRLLECLMKTGHADGFGETMGELLEDKLRTARIVRPADGSRPRRPSALTRLAMGSPKLEQSMLPLIQPTRDLVRPGDDLDDAGAFLEQLGTEELSWAEIAGRVDLSKSPNDYAAGLRGLARLLEAVDEPRRAEVVEVLRSRRIVKDTQGRWRTPRDVVVHRPDSPELPSRLRATELAQPSGASIRRLVRALAIPELSVATGLDIVLTAVHERAFGRRSDEARQIHTFMKEAWKEARHEVEARGRKLGVVPVPARKARGRRVEWTRADCVYFSSEWTGNRLLETLYGGFGDSEFLASRVPADTVTKRSSAKFYTTLGVATEPRMMRRVGTTFEREWRDDLSAYAQWLEVVEVKLALTCEAGHPQTPRQMNFSSLDRLDELLADDEREKSAALARYLGSKESSRGADAEIFCTGSSHYGQAPRKRAIGYQRWRLENTAWIPVRNDPSGKDKRPPHEAWTGTRLPKWLMVPQARLQAEDARGLHLISAERPGVAGLERALRDLNQHFPDLADSPEVIRKSADWLLTRLDRVLQRPQTAGPTPPLPCTAGGRVTWSMSPLIPDLAGLHEFADVEVLPPKAWRGLRRGYGLQRASEVVTVEVDEGDRLRGPRLLSREQQARLAAVLASLGADEDRVATRLARLREFGVTSIRLRYSFNGRPASEFAARPSYLAIHRDRANRVRGASLFVTQPVVVATRIALGRDLAAYLETPDLYDSIGLFLTHPDAKVESENISLDDIAEAGRRVESHRRGKEEPEESPFDPEDLLDPFGEGLDEDGEGREEGATETETGAGNGTRTSGGDSPTDSPPELPLPDLDHDAVIATDVLEETSAVVEPPAGGGGGSKGGGGGTGRRDWAQLERDRRLYGRRGEEVVYENEQRRVVDRGWDSDLVKWASRDNELSAYDIESLDDGGNRMFIEVKATTGADPSEPFPISTSELRFALQHRSEYSIYRVTSVKSASPRIHRYRDPLGEVESQRGYLRTNKALMGLPLPND